MEVDVQYNPAYALAIIKLTRGEQIRAESGAMVSMSRVAIETQATGGLFKSLTRSFLGGESFFQNTFTAVEDDAELTLAPSLPGDIRCLELEQENIMVQSSSYLASEMDISVDTKWSGAKTFFASEGAIMLMAAGTGKLLLSSYGAIHEKDLAEGETYTVDTGHLVAFSEGIGFQVKRVGGLKSTFFSGEGLVVQLTGPGRVLIQTRSQDAFLSWLLPKLPKQTNA